MPASQFASACPQIRAVAAASTGSARTLEARTSSTE
jgi:hypothetical protein